MASIFHFFASIIYMVGIFVVLMGIVGIFVAYGTNESPSWVFITFVSLFTGVGFFLILFDMLDNIEKYYPAFASMFIGLLIVLVGSVLGGAA